MQQLTRYSLGNRLRIIFMIALAEFLLFVISGTSFSFLHGDPFFSLKADPASWIFYIKGLPQFIVGHQWVAIMLDIVIILLFILVIKDPAGHKKAILLFLLMLLYYVTLTGYLTHRNYQLGMFMVFVPFAFRKEINREYAFEATRYFLLFFYASAALLKLWSGSLFDQATFSHLLTSQFTPYFLEGNTGIRTQLNLYLINHPATAQLLYICSFIAELTAIAGFFRRKFDKWIAILLLSFHFANWIVMDIAPFGQLAFICLFFLDRKRTIAN